MSLSTRLYSQPWPDYELLDTGNGKKLERWGDIITIRPDIQAHLNPVWPYADWQERGHWQFNEQSPTQGSWQQLKPHAPDQWTITYQQLKFGLKLTQFKHVGLFPEQQANWHFLTEQVGEQHKILNLFAYTGAASLIARQHGAEVVHVDSVRQMLGWAKSNMELSGLTDIQWVLEDALKFAQRELKRGKQYDGIIMDPPAWGLGAKGEKWKLENQLPGLVATAQALLKPKGFLVLNTYSPKISLPDLASAAATHFPDSQVEIKQLWLSAQTGNDLYCGNLLRVQK